MSSSLSRIPPPKRRQLAATLALFAVLFVAVGAVAQTGKSTGVIQVFVTVALVVAVLLALIAWGVAHSIKADLVVGRLDAAIEQAVKAHGGQLCDCGHEHDPTELHVTDDPCDQDGHGVACTHSCTTCVLATMRPAPVAPGTSAGRHRPAPQPRRPSPYSTPAQTSRERRAEAS